METVSMDPVGVLKYVTTSSVLLKRAVDEINQFQAKEAAARPMIGPTVDLGVRYGLFPEGTQKEASALLSTHKGTLELLQSAMNKMAEMQHELTQKSASDLGHEYNPPAVGPAVVDPTKTPYIGLRTHYSPADAALMRIFEDPRGR